MCWHIGRHTHGNTRSPVYQKIGKTGWQYNRLIEGIVEILLKIDRFFIDLLHSHGYIIHIETNGTHAIPDGIDWITVSPKTSRIALDRADEVKIVFTGQDVDSWLHFDANHRYLQPCSCRNTPEVIQNILAHPEWSLSLQTHKYIYIP